MKDMEHQEQKLRAALRELPRYQPPPALWAGIAAELEQEEREAPLREALAQLPSYGPPEALWPRIAAELPQAPSRRPALRRALAWASAAAATAALLLAAYYFRPAAELNLLVSYSHRTESAPDPALYAIDWEEDEQDLQAVAARFVKAPAARQHPHFEIRRQEWEELGDARQEILDFMQRYGRDGALIRQLAAIERERSALARQMAEEI